MKILVCGGRDTKFSYEDFYKEMIKQIEDIDDWYSIVIIHGGARGIDSFAHKLAKDICCDRLVYPANWALYGKSAGPLRNKQMLEEGKPNLVIAFPGGKGTAHMVKIAKEAGVPVTLIEDKEKLNEEV